MKQNRIFIGLVRIPAFAGLLFVCCGIALLTCEVAKPMQYTTTQFQGRILDGWDSSAVAGALVSVGSQSVVTDMFGNFLFTGVRTGVSQVVVTATGFDTLTKSVDILIRNDAVDYYLVNTNAAPVITAFSLLSDSLKPARDSARFSFDVLEHRDFVRLVRIDYGDGAQDTIAMVSMGAQGSFSHLYQIPGSYHVSLLAADSLGLLSQAAESVYVLPWNIRPTILRFSADPETVTVKEQMARIQYAAYDSDGTIQTARISFGDGSYETVPAAFPSEMVDSTEHTYPRTGIFVLRLMVKDSEGDSAIDSTSCRVVVRNAPPHVKLFRAEPETVKALGDSIRFVYTVSDTNDSIQQVRVGIAGGSSQIQQYGTTRTIRDTMSFVCSSAGLFQAGCAATDLRGESCSSSVAFRVLANHRPVPSIELCDPAYWANVPGGKIRIGVSDSDGNDKLCTVDWGDGSRNDSIFTYKTDGYRSHTYSQTGYFQIRLSALDQSGAIGQCSTEVLVRTQSRPVLSNLRFVPTAIAGGTAQVTIQVNADITDSHVTRILWIVNPDAMFPGSFETSYTAQTGSEGFTNGLFENQIGSAYFAKGSNTVLVHVEDSNGLSAEISGTIPKF